MSLSNTLVKPATEQTRANVLGVGVHAIDMADAAVLIDSAIAEGRKGYVCLTGVHGVMEAQRDDEFRGILNEALMVAPDGMPMVWVGRSQGFPQMRRVYGPDLMLEVCRRSVTNGATHFLYGGNHGVAEKLRDNLEQWFPGIRIVGTHTPPFRPLFPRERMEIKHRMGQLHPDIIWVGMSTPKQERFMAENIEHYSCGVMIGVGAAFDIHTGNLKDAPQWIKSSGLQWAHRLWQEPSRLWKRYLINNPAFLCRIILQMAGLHRYELRRPLG